MIVYLSLSVVVRLSGYDSDIQTYMGAMDFDSYSFYYLKEPVVWIGQRFLYDMLGSKFVVFLVFDAVGGFFVFAALTRINVPQYLYFSILLFFPFVMGFQNVYRQWLSMCIFLFAFGTVYQKHYRLAPVIFIYFPIAVASHNVSAVFFSLIVLLKRSQMFKVLSLVILLALPVALVFFEGTKSSANTGLDLSLLYVFSILVFSIFMFLINRRCVNASKGINFVVCVYILVVALFSWFFLSSTSSERVSMFGLMVVYVLLAKDIDLRVKQKFISRVCVSSCGFFPLFVFGTRSFII